MVSSTQPNSRVLKVGAERTISYLHFLKDKKIGVVANQTSVIQNTHLVDSLVSLKIDIQTVFAPEHGFRGTADAGELITNDIDHKTGIPIISLYGKNKKPTHEQLAGIDVMLFDIQDVGTRFYTYISTLHYVMEACAENNIPLILLDRPNPNGHYIDGPVLEMEHQSFVGMHPVPVVYGMTIGEFGQMINGERWLKNNVVCKLNVIPLKNYNRKSPYNLPIKPSPNLPTAVSINLYPSLCFFEGTNVSVGRGTNFQFQIVGSPFYKGENSDFSFMPLPNEGSKYPKHQSKLCRGYDLRNQIKLDELSLKWLIDFYKNANQTTHKTPFFNDFFTKLAGTKKLQQQIEKGFSEYEIKKTWKPALKEFNTLRVKYLLY